MSTKGWVMSFSTDFLNANGIPHNFILKINLFRQYSDSPPIKLDDNSSSRLKIITKMLHDTFSEHDMYRGDIIGALMKLFLIECIHMQKEEGSEKAKERSCVLIDFRNSVEEHFSELHKVSDYADLLFITPKHLNQVIKDTIGCTAKEYIMDRIITEAKRLLIHTDRTVKDLALSLGFTEPLHFNAFFKKRTNLSPLDLRKQSTLNV